MPNRLNWQETNNPPDENIPEVRSNRGGALTGCDCVSCNYQREQYDLRTGVIQREMDNADIAFVAREVYVRPESEESDNPYESDSAYYWRFVDAQAEMRRARQQRERDAIAERASRICCTHCNTSRTLRPYMYDVSTGSEVSDSTDPDNSDITPVCDRCLQSWYFRCGHYGCYRYVRNNAECPIHPDDGSTGETYEVPRPCEYCYNCNHDSGCDNRQFIQNYSFRPIPVFHGIGPVFMGFELEVAYGPADDDKAAMHAVSELGTLAYLKEDGSVNGFEIVTHPMSYDYAMSGFPWHLLSELDELGMEADSTCGLHIHVSKKGFTNPAHIYRWMKFFYRNRENIVKIARRESSEWAKFSPSARREIKDYAKGKKGQDRYSAINTQNRSTFEVRIFASSLDEADIKACLGLVDATVEYTRQLTTADILKKKGWDWQSFQSWLPAKYAPLRLEMDELCVY